ncbi:MAG TPA: glycosyltransferase family A protein [Ohtaekwangia sp.]|uniref:glycosyltransferase family 2 protein n=1 Tax=Ohtaekwangia sp. TaxID=2066019 RepID=UPI002F9421B8
MGTTELITVIIPVYNRENIIKRSVESVIRQSFKQWKLLVIDDCSTDDTFAVASSISDPRIQVLKTRKNSGAAAARNAGIQHAVTPYISLLDSDDMYHPDFLKYSIQAIESTNDSYGFTYTGVGDIEAYKEGEPVSRSVWTLPDRFSKFKKPYLYQLQVGTAAGITIKKEAFDKIGLFDESLRAAEDTDWFIRASEFYQGLPIHKNLIFKDNNLSDRLTINYSKNAFAYKVIMAKQSQEIQNSVFLMTRWYYKSMWLNFYSGNKKEATLDYKVLKAHKLADLKIVLTYFSGVILSRALFIKLHKKLAKLK